MAVAYLQGGAQTTVTATMTELFPALWFNTKNKKPTNVKELEDFIYDYDNKSNKAYLDGQDRESGKKNIDLAFTKIEPKMKQVKLQNAFAITNYLFDTDAENPINYVVWGYRKKPDGVPDNHSGDVFLIHKNKDITGVSLKAGLDKSMEPKLNTYVESLPGIEIKIVIIVNIVIITKETKIDTYLYSLNNLSSKSDH